MPQQQSIRKRQSSGPVIPDKLYFRIGEVADLCDLPAYVLRFWETEFPQLKPNKGGTGQRLYRRRDVELALRIKSLLYSEGYTIPGARSIIKTEVRAPKEPDLGLRVEAPPTTHPAQILRIRRELREILALLSKPVAKPQPAAKHFKLAKADTKLFS